MSKFYNSTTLKSVELNDGSILTFDLAKEKRNNVILTTSLYNSSYRQPINLSLIKSFNKTEDIGFGPGVKLNVVYKLTRVSDTKLKITYPTFDEEEFVYDSSKDEIKTTPENYVLSIDKYYYSTNFQRYIVENIQHDVVFLIKLVDKNCDVIFKRASNINQQIQNHKLKIKDNQSCYELDLTYNNNNEIVSISNNLPEKEIVNFVYSSTTQKIQQIKVNKDFETNNESNASLIAKVDINYSYSAISEIKNYLKENLVYIRTYSLQNNALKITDLIVAASSIINFGNDINGLYVDNIQHEFCTTNMIYKSLNLTYNNNYKTTIVTGDESEEYFFDSQYDLINIQNNNALQIYEYKNSKIKLISKPLYKKASLNGSFVESNDFYEETGNISCSESSSNNCPMESKVYTVAVHSGILNNQKIVFEFNQKGTKFDVINVLICYKANIENGQCSNTIDLSLFDEEGNEVDSIISQGKSLNLTTLSWKYTIATIQAKNNFDKVKLNLTTARSPINYDISFALYKDELTTLYEYDINGNTSKILSGKEIISYGFNSKNNLMISKYTANSYDKDGRVFHYVNPKRVTTDLTYDEYGNILSQTIKTNNNSTIGFSNIYNNNEYLIQKTNINNQITSYGYDSTDKKLKSITNYEYTVELSYDEENGLVNFIKFLKGNTQYNKLRHVYTLNYDLDSVTENFGSNNEIFTSFNYDQKHRINAVMQDYDLVYERNNSETNNLLLSCNYGDSSKTFDYEYETENPDTLYNIKCLKYQNMPMFSYSYSTDGKGLLNQIINHLTKNINNDATYYNYEYDNNSLKSLKIKEGATIKHTNNLSYNQSKQLFAERNIYDNIVNQTHCFNSSLIPIKSINGFEYKLLSENNDNLYWTMMIDRKFKKAKNDILNISHYLYNKTKQIAPIYEFENTNIEKRGLNLLKLNSNEAYSFDCEKLNFGNNFGIFFAFKLSSESNQPVIFSLGTDNIINNCALRIAKGAPNSEVLNLIYGDSNNNVFTAEPIQMNSMFTDIHFLGINVTKETNNYVKFDILVDNEFKREIVANKNLILEKINFFNWLGGNPYNGYLGGIILNTQNHISEEKMKEYAEELKSIYDNNDNYLNDFDVTVNSDSPEHDMIIFDHNFTSFDGVKPTVQLNGSSMKSINDNFEYVEDVINDTQGSYVYAIKNQRLHYNLNLENSGTISLRFKVLNSLTLLHLSYLNVLDIRVACDENNHLYLFVNSLVSNKDLSCSNNSWHTLSVCWNKKLTSASLETYAFNITFYLDGNLAFSKDISTIDSISSIICSLGNTISGSICEQTTKGYIEKLLFSNSSISTSTALKIHNNLSKTSYVKNYYDELSRLKEKNIVTLNNECIQTDYVYKTFNSTNSTYLLLNEKTNMNNKYYSVRAYSYDSYGNITNIGYHYSPMDSMKNIIYTYDKGRLTSESDGTTIKKYDYNVKGDLAQIRYGNSIIKTFTYDGHRLIGVNNDIIEYDGFFPKYYKDNANNILKEFSFSGSQLTSLIDYTNNVKFEYFYNTFGLREQVRKINLSNNQLQKLTNYYYNINNQLVTEVKTEYNNGTASPSCVIMYMYDGNGQLFGFKVNNVPYYYIRDGLGNINEIVDSTKSLIARIKYEDAWGNHKIYDRNNNEVLIDNAIAIINPFRYKGYYFDVETGLFWLSSRYYSPELCRFISPDSVDYLEPESINGLNLYAYAKNNPIMYYDPSGHSAILVIGLLVGSFIVGAGASVVSQGLTYGWDEINYWQAGVDGLFALGSTALAMTGIGALASAGIGAVAGWSQYAIGSAFHGEDLTLLGSITAAGLGFIGGAISGAGARNSSNIASNMRLTGKGASAVKAITTASNRYLAGEISMKGLQATARLWGNVALNAVQDAIAPTIRHLMIKGALTIAGVTIGTAAVNCGLYYAY